MNINITDLECTTNKHANAQKFQLHRFRKTFITAVSLYVFMLVCAFIDASYFYTLVTSHHHIFNYQCKYICKATLCQTCWLSSLSKFFQTAAKLSPSLICSDARAVVFLFCSCCPANCWVILTTRVTCSCGVLAKGSKLAF